MKTLRDNLDHAVYDLREVFEGHVVKLTVAISYLDCGKEGRIELIEEVLRDNHVAGRALEQALEEYKNSSEEE